VRSTDKSPKNRICDSGKEVWFSTQHINTLGLDSSSLRKEIVPMKKWIMFVCCLALFACALNSAFPYVPNPNVSDPAKVVQRIMISQPPDYAGAVPFKVSVKSDSLEMWMTEPGGGGKFGESHGVIYYKNIGKVVLNHTDIWYVEIFDHSGIWMYNGFSFEESEAKQFIDALYTVMGKQ
jgi:hypothetical protein